MNTTLTVLTIVAMLVTIIVTLNVTLSDYAKRNKLFGIDMFVVVVQTCLFVACAVMYIVTVF